MPEVKSIFVRMSETGAAQTRDALRSVSEAADKAGRNITIGAKVDGFAQAMAQLRLLRAAAEEAGLPGTSFSISGKEGRAGFRLLDKPAFFDEKKFRLQLDQISSDSNRAFFQAEQGVEGYRRKLEDLNTTLYKVDKALGDQQGGGGLFSKLTGILKSIAGFSIGPVPVGGIALGAAVSPAFGSITGGTLGIIPLLAAATAGVGAFGALAFPTFQRVAAAIGFTGDKLRDLPQPLRGTVIAVQGVVSTFTGLAKVLGPQIMPIIKDLAPGIKQLIGDLGPFAHAIAPVLDHIAKAFSQFTMSKGFKDFLDQLLKMSPQAVATIAEGLGQLAIAFGKLLLQLSNPNSVKDLKMFFQILAGSIGAVGTVVHALDNIGHAVGNLDHAIGNFVHFWKGMWDQTTSTINTAGTIISDILSGKIPQAGAKLVAWFATLPGKVVSLLGGLAGKLNAIGAQAISGLISGLASGQGGVIGIIAHIGSLVTGGLQALLGIHSPSTVMMKIGQDIIDGLVAGMVKGRPKVLNVVRDLGIQISDKLMDAFMSRNDKRADAAANQIAQILKARLFQIRSVIIGVAQAQVQWASIVSAATGPAFAPMPHWIAGTPGSPGTPATFSHTGVPIGGTPATPGTPGHWAGGVRPVTGQQLLRNLRLDLGRLRAFAHVMARLRRMGLDPVLWQQILAAGPDQGFPVAEAILDAGRGEIRALDRTERQIYQTGVGLGRTAAKSQFGGGITYVINFNGFIAGNPRAIAREIQKLLADLRRHNGGQALGLG